MKTKIRTFIIVCGLALTGFNASATKNYINLRNNVVFEDEKNVRSLKADENLTMLNEKTGTIGSVVNENSDAVLDYQKEAELIMKDIANLEEARTIQILLNKSIRNLETGDLNEKGINVEQTEAQLVMKMVADQQEARTVRKLVEDGRL